MQAFRTAVAALAGGVAGLGLAAGAARADATADLVAPGAKVEKLSGGFTFTEGLRATPQGGKWGYIDRAGTFVIPPRFDEAWGFSEGLAAVRQDGLWGFVDRTGRLPIPARYFRVDDGFVRGLAYVTVRQPDPCCQGIYRFAEGFIDHQGREFFDAPQ